MAPIIDIVRRSRIDLQGIKEYAEDLKIQGIQFPKVVAPELVEYDLGEIRPLYLHTLDLLSNKFICARNNSSAYVHSFLAISFQGRKMKKVLNSFVGNDSRWLLSNFFVCNWLDTDLILPSVLIPY